MQSLYFYVIPVIVAGYVIYRGWYSLKPNALPTQLLVIIAFMVFYSVKFGVGIGLGVTALLIILVNIWGAAVRKERERKYNEDVALLKQEERARAPKKKSSDEGSPIEEKSFDDYISDVESIFKNKENK